MRVISIGRSGENDVVINDVHISRTHLQIVQRDNGDCSVVDLNSKNGTFVNGQRITGEVKLRPNDSIRIGNIELPWQSYLLKNSILGDPPFEEEQPPKPKRSGMHYIVLCVVLLVLLAGGITACYYYCNGKKQEKIEDPVLTPVEIKKEQLRQEAEQKAEEAKRLQEEADELFRQALISQNDKSKALAEIKQKEATQAKIKAEKAIAAQQEAERAKVAAEKAKEEANKAKILAEQNSLTAIKNAETKANEAISQANTERDSANEKARLTEKFYEEYAEMKLDFAKQVYKQLKYEIPKDKIDVRKVIKDLFNVSDNRGKQAIIDAIQIVKEQNNKVKSNHSDTKSDSLISSKKEEITDVKSAVESDE